MRRFAISLLCALFMVACGRTESKLTPVDDCEECTCEGMVPAVHEHPDPSPVDVHLATGIYAISFLLTGDTCDEEFDAEEEVASIPMYWLLGSTQEYDFLLRLVDGFMFTSTNGETFVYTSSGPTMWCDNMDVIHSMELVFESSTLSGIVTSSFDAEVCYTGEVEEDGTTPITESISCGQTLGMEGTRYETE